MTLDFQTILVFVFFAGSIGYLIYLPIRKKNKKKKACGGGDCGGQ